MWWASERSAKRTMRDPNVRKVYVDNNKDVKEYVHKLFLI